MANSLVLLPTYNERENLLRVLPRLAALEEDLDVLVIDDASPDGTGALAEELRSRYAHLSVLHRIAKEGLGRAYVHGFKEALRRGYTRIVTMDADLSHAPEDVPRLLAALEEADVSIGSRHTPGGGVKAWPFGRWLLSRGGSLYARTLLHLPVSDVTSGFRAYRAKTLGRLDLDGIEARGFVFQVEILQRILDLRGTKAVEVPILFRNRTRGSSKLSGGIIAEAAWEVAKLTGRKKDRSERPSPGRPVDRFPRLSVVVPVPPEVEEPKALAALEAITYPAEQVKVLVARGRSPSRQRNEAVKASSGEYLLFLDDDSEASKSLVNTYISVLENDPKVGAVGGPAESLGGSGFQGLAALVLGEPWVTGKTASRYRARGRARFTDERELILCNLCVRREAFEDLEGFEEDLYPNEENEFLERMRLRGWRLVYRPDARVRRPQREGLRELLSAVARYGSGRAAQMRLLPSRISFLRLAFVLLGALGGGLGILGVLKGSVLLASPLLAYGIYLAALALRLSARASVGQGLAAAILSALVQGSYALGLLKGLLFRTRLKHNGVITIENPEFKRECVFP